ncbi:MAG TPA: heparinase II/III-family protein, partial [Gemmatimonadaceae bacterium]|nr:heparinase II/III-family protein [Gemmatimonadaceae bacterium]
PDEETLAWLAVSPPLVAPAPAVPRVRFGGSGWVHGVTSGARIFARAGSYRGRPGHIDALHVDVWIGGRPVARDAGTYRYAGPAPWRNGLAGEAVHNTLTIPGQPMARRGPRFLWLGWPRARIASVENPADGNFLVRLLNESWAEQGIAHERTCELHADGVLVVDRLLAPRDSHLAPIVHWLVDGQADDISVIGSGGAERSDAVGDESSVMGWISEGYGHKREARSVQLLGAVEEGRFVAVTGFGAMRDEARLRARLAAELAR